MLAWVVIGYLLSRVPMWLWAMLVVLAVFFSVTPARAEGAFAAPDWQEYFTGLMMPDSKITSCCGVADAYIADETDKCTEEELKDFPTCALVAIITDDRPDVLKLKDGREIHRQHIDKGTRIIVYKSKLRRPPSINPTDHTIVFTAGTIAYCYEPVGGI